MTLYNTEFIGYTVDVVPSGFTPRWNTSNGSWTVKSSSTAAGGMYVQHSSTADGWRLLSWDSIDSDSSRSDVELFTRVRVRTASASAYHQTMLVARGSGTSGTETGYILSFASILSSGLGGVRLRKIVNGTVTNLGSEYLGDVTFVAETWYNMRFKVSGSSLYGKVWADGTNEPAAWQVTATDTSITAAGWVGLGNYESTGTTRDFDAIYVATGADAVTIPISESTQTKTSSITSEALIYPDVYANTSSVVLETALKQVSPAYVHQEVIEVALGFPVNGYVHQEVIEVALGFPVNGYINQTVAEVALGMPVYAHNHHTVIEVIVGKHLTTTPFVMMIC